ncbi:TRAP transporter substrate-binding protein [Romboutsia ilealis]|uniref:TRAP transporter substrate-binding protein n=1 Tax=Romboutsia ilealis TaxID=1115758 RepID=UPI0025A59036|nr:TRAP transporter substrate-binding protein [Romboutsia ilealis]
MKLKKLGILFAVIVSLAIVGYSSRNDDNGVIHMKLAHNMSEDHPIHKSLSEFERLVEEKSKGTIDIEIYPNGVLGSEREMIELTQTGAIDIAKVSTGALESFEQQYTAFGIPYIFDNLDHYYSVMDDRELMDELYNSTDESGFIGLTYYDSGVRSLYTTSKAIMKPSDLKGLKIRVQQSPTAIKMIDLMGGSATPMAFGEVYTGLQQGVIDGAESNETALTTNKHGEVAKYFSYNQHTIVPDLTIMNRKLYDKLTEEQKNAIIESAIESTEYHKVVWNESIENAVEEAKSMGVQFYYPDTKPFQEAVMPLHEEFKEEAAIKIMYDKIRSKVN